MTGIGGEVPWWEFDAALRLNHNNGGRTSIAQSLAVLGSRNIPSLLGRDILSHGILTLDGPGGRVSFDIPEGFVR
jgi:hypothetical protein